MYIQSPSYLLGSNHVQKKIRMHFKQFLKGNILHPLIHSQPHTNVL